MNTPINLNKARKARLRADKHAKADENALKFGRSKAQRQVEDTDKSRAAQHLDQHRRDPE